MSVKLRWKSLQDGRKSAYLDIYHNGERQYEFLKVYLSPRDPDRREKKQLAESIRAKRELDMQNDEYGFIPQHRQKVDFLEYYRKFLAGYKGRDRRLVRYSLEKFQLMVKRERLPAKEVTPKLCQGYADFLKDPDSGLKGETPYNYWTKFKRVLKQAVKDGILRNNPADGIVVRRIVGQLKKNVLTREELQALAQTECGNLEVKRAFLFACYTGLGMAEIRKLTWERINNGKITIFREKTREQIINDLHPVTEKLLGAREELSDKIFSLPSDVAISKDLKNWAKRAGIEKNISFYSGRHTFATQLLLNGANLKTVADCLGHTSTRHTLKYLNYVDELKAEAIGKLPMLDW